MLNKSIKFILLSFIGILGISFMNVKAETTLPYSGSVNDIKYQIESFEIQIYTIDYLKNNLSNKREPLKTVQVPASEITMNPQEDIVKSDESTKMFNDFVAVKLNFTNEKELFEKYVKQELSSDSSSEKYYCVFLIKYKITQLPDQYKYLYHLGWDNVDKYVDLFSTGKMPNVDTNTSILQSFSSAVYTKSTTNLNYDEKVVLGESELGEQTITATGDSMALGEYCLVTNEEFNFENLTKYENFIFHNNSDLKSTMVSEQQKIDEDSDDFWQEHFGVDKDEFLNNNGSSNVETKQIQTVKVPNTDARSSGKILFGISIMLLGSAVVLWELRKKYNN